jgi:hypothetical protein
MSGDPVCSGPGLHLRSGRPRLRTVRFEAAPHAPVAHPVTHENARAVSAVGIGIGVVVAIAIGRHFDIDSDSEPDTDSDPEIPSERSIFGAALTVDRD